MNERELLDALRDGDGSMAPLAVSLYGRPLVKYLTVVYPWISEVDREMLCERAIEKAVVKIGGFNSDQGTWLSWMRAFVRHEVLDAVRRGELSSVEFPPEYAAAGTLPALEDSSQGELIEEIRRCMRSLSDADNVILSLRTIEGLDYATIARELEVDEAACRQRHRRALVRLKRELSQSSIGLSLIESTGLEVPK